MHVFDASTAWISQGPDVYKTLNGGTSFPVHQINVPGFNMFFRNTDLGWTVSDGNINKTADGTNWVAQTSGTTEPFSDVFFLDDNNGWVLGNTWALKTTNSGTNWSASSLGNFYYASSICFSDINTGWIAIGQGTLKSTDGGNSWSLFTPEADRGEITQTYQIRFIDSNNGMLIGNIDGQPDRWFCYTNDGGNTWISQSFATSEIINQLDVVDMDTAYAVGRNGALVKISK